MEEKKYRGITVRFEPGWVRVLTDEALTGYLEQEGRKDAEHLAEWILEEYRKLLGYPLKIDRDSLAVEILIHACLDTISERLEDHTIQSELPGAAKRLLKGICGKIQKHTDIIDCGEKEVDNNRLVFDGLAAFHEAIYQLLE